MQKMLVKVNKEKMKELGISEYYIDLTLHDAFDEGHFFAEEQEDGAILYISTLSDDEKFMAVCDKWIWYNNERTGDGSFAEEDVLEGIKNDENFD